MPTFAGLQSYTSAISLTKAGTGAFVLAGANTYSGATIVNGGTLQVNGSLGTNSVTVASGASLGGTGTIGGQVVVQPGGTLAPGAGGLGTLTVNKSPSLAGVVRLEISKGAVPNADKLAVSPGAPGLTYAGTLTVTNIGTNAFAVGDSFTLFSATSFGGSFASITLPALPAWQGWTNKLALDGSIEVVQHVATNPPAISLGASGGPLVLSWPSDHTGWRLQAQTNTLAVGLAPAWYDVADSASTNVYTMPIDSANPSVFFRLVFP
jgi:autotransporter-associated beta strand protein